MRFIATVVGCVASLGASPVFAQGDASPVEAFKLGTFQIEAGPQVGIVVQDSYVIELDRGNEALAGQSRLRAGLDAGRHAGAHRAVRIRTQVPDL